MYYMRALFGCIAGLMCIRDMDEDTLKASEMPFSTPSAAGNDVMLSAKRNRIMPENRYEFVRQALNYR